MFRALWVCTPPRPGEPRTGEEERPLTRVGSCPHSARRPWDQGH